MASDNPQAEESKVDTTPASSQPRLQTDSEQTSGQVTVKNLSLSRIGNGNLSMFWKDQISQEPRMGTQENSSANSRLEISVSTISQ